MLVLGLGVLAIVVVATLASLLLERVGSDPPVAAPPSPQVAASDEPEPQRSPRPPRERQRAGRPVNLNDLAREVVQVRELELRRRLRSRVLPAASLAQKVTDLGFSENDPEEVEADQRLLVALRLAPPGIDLLRIVEALYREQILGLYVPQERTLYVLGGAGRGSAAQRLTSAHEITHALQDQHYDLVALQKAAEADTDAGLALLALIEGDAVLTQQLWSEQFQTQAQRQEAFEESQAGAGDALAEAPPYLRAGLFFPYQQGSAFVADLYREGGFAAVDRAFAAPPTTSEQILHPEKYRAGEVALPVDVPRRPGPRWRRSAAYTFGEFDLQEMLTEIGPGTATVAAEGWGGGEVRSWVRRGSTAVAVALAFDSDGDATEACDSLAEWYIEVADAQRTGDGMYRGDRDHLALDCAGSTVRFGLAEDPNIARRLTTSG